MWRRLYIPGSSPPPRLKPGMYKENLREMDWFSLDEKGGVGDLISVSEMLMAVMKKVEVHEGKTKCTRCKLKDSKLH